MRHADDGTIRPNRRQVLIAGTAGTAGVLVWSAPSILSIDAARAATAPPQAAHMVLWLKGDTGVSVSGGDFVESWADQSDGENDALPFGSSPPTMDGSSISGFGAVTFAGDGGFFEVPISIDPTVAPFVTVFAVFQSAADTGRHKLYGSDNGNFDRTVGLDERSGTNYGYFGGTTTGVGSYFTLSLGSTYVTVDQWAPTTFSGSVNGGSDVVGATVDNGPSMQSLSIGALNSGGTESWHGLIAELIAWVGDTPMASDDLDSTTNYLIGKYLA